MKQTFSKLMLLMLTLLVTIGINAAKKVHTIGDSTMAPYDEEATITRGWGMYFGDFLINGWTSQNYAKGGRDARSGYNELWLQNAKDNVEAGDYVLIQFAHNDEKFNGVDHDELAAIQTLNDTRGTNPSTTYKTLLKKICDEVKEKGATPILVSPVCRFWFDNNGKIKRSGRHDLGDKYDQIEGGQLKTGLSLPADDHTMDYAWQMKQLAEAENIQFIDLTTATQELFEEYGSEKCAAELQSEKTENGVTKVDGTHFRYMGALLVARLCAQLMKNAGVLADNIDVPTELSVLPAEANMGESYVGITLTKELTIRGFGLTPETGKVNVSATNGIELSLDKQNWKSSLEVNYASGILVKPFYARVILSAVGEVDGTITVSDGTKNINIPVTATGLEVSTGVPVTISWPFTTDNTAKVEGPLTAEQTLIGMTATDYADGVQSLDVTSGTWPKAEDDDAGRYTAFSLTSTSDNTLKIDNIAMKVGTKGGALSCHIYYTTDNFQTRKTLKELTGMADGSSKEVSAQPIISLKKGETLQLRIYPWSEEEATGRQFTISDLVISGVEEGAGLQNEPVTVTYKFDEGKAGQTATYGPKSQANSWFKSSYIEVGSNLEYHGSSSVGGVTQTLFQPKAKSNAGGSEIDNIDFIFVSKKGLYFTPTKISFKATRYGTGGGNFIISWVDNDGNVTKIEELNTIARNNATPAVTEYSKTLTGINANSGSAKLRLNLWKLDNNKQVGISDIVIEGTFTGIPKNSVQYRLTTSVNIDEAGSVNVTPAGIMFDEGDEVTVTANKNFGYKFVEWQDADGNQISTKAEETVTMDAAKTMNAIFQKVNVYKVSTKVTNDAEREGLGSITLTLNDHNGQYEEGTKITATANESKIIKFLSWTDDNENAGASKERELTVNSDMTLVANYELQDFIAVFDASKTAAYDYEGKAFSADEVWDANRNAKSCIVKQSDGSLVYSKSTGTPVVRNRQSVVLTGINGLYQNGYNTAEIAWQYQFSTIGFTSATFNADMAAKNAATKNWKAQYSVDGSIYNDLGESWQMTANVATPLSFTLPDDAIGKETVYVRIMGTDTELLSSSYAFTAGEFCGLQYATNSESGVGNVYVLGDAVVVADETAPVVSGTIPANQAAGVSATGKITITFDERIKSANSNAAVTLGDKTLQPEWNSRSVSFNYSQLDYGTQYTFQMPANYVQDRSGNKYAEAVVISFTTMQRPTVAKALYNFIVPTDGSIDEALAAANGRADKNSRYRVFIKNSAEPYVFHPSGKVTGGDGKEYDNPTSVLTAANTSFIGESMEGVVITNITPDATWDNGFGPACPLEGIGKGDVLQIKGDNSYFQNLTIHTSMGDSHGRDIAVNDQSNRTIFKDACLWGYQDTYVSNNQNGKFFFEGGVIRGRTDYVCGKGDVYYNKVTFQQVKSGYLAVPSVPKQYGYIFQSCKIVGDTEDANGTYTLGRPWGKGTPIALFIDTEMEILPTAAGWSEMSGGYPKRFAEYGSHTSSGAPVDASGRKTVYDAYDSKDGDTYTNRREESNNPILTAEEAAIPTLQAVMGQDDQWQPTLLTEQAPVPTNVTLTGKTLSWDDSNYALLWAVCLDGKVVAFTTEPTYTVSSDGEYTVRAANEMGGLSAPSLVATTTDGISDVVSKTPEAISDIYTLDGKRVSQLQRGLNIVRLQNGKTLKVIR